MKARVAACAAMLVLGATPAAAHRLDAYLQATTIHVGKDRLQAHIRLLPGVAVFRTVVGAIDTNADGVLSGAEQRAYALVVLRDLSLAVDGQPLPLTLTTCKYASVSELQEGRGVIEIDFEATAPRGGPDRQLTFENHHQPRIGEYLVNALVPRDPDIHITGQSRNYKQSSFQLKYAQAGVGTRPASAAWWSGITAWLLAPGARAP